MVMKDGEVVDEVRPMTAEVESSGPASSARRRPITWPGWGGPTSSCIDQGDPVENLGSTSTPPGGSWPFPTTSS